MNTGRHFKYSAGHTAIFPLVAAALALQFALGEAFAAEGRQLERTGVIRARVVTAARLPYLAITPANFNDRTQRWPLIVFLHGGDQSEGNLDRVKENGPPKFALTNPDFPFVVVAPHLPVGHLWEPDAVFKLVKQVVRRFRIDEGRIYLTGLSTGGYGTWNTALKYPERFAAVVPVAGGGSTEILIHAEGAHLQALRSLAVWAFHGGSDPAISADESQRMISELQRVGNAAARLTIFPGAPHDVWSRVYDDPALYDWLLQQRR